MRLVMGRSRLLVLSVSLVLITVLGAPSEAAKPDRPDPGPKVSGSMLLYEPRDFAEIPESLRWLTVNAYDGTWRFPDGDRFTGDGVRVEADWATCEPFSDPSLPEADALLRLYRWGVVTTLGPGEGSVTFTDDGHAGALDISLNIPGRYMEIPAAMSYPDGCYQVADPIVDEALERRLDLTLEWSSVISGKGKKASVDTTVTAAAGSFGGVDMTDLPFGDKGNPEIDPRYVAWSGPFVGFVEMVEMD